MAAPHVNNEVPSTIVGNTEALDTTQVSIDLSAASSRYPSCGGRELALSTSLCIAVLAVQVATYISCEQYCSRFHSTRFELWIWLSPLYLLGPWSSTALMGVFVHRHDSFSNKLVLHRWTWRFAYWNLIASICSPVGSLMRECSTSLASRLHLAGAACEVLWVTSYTVSEGILLGLVWYKVKVLEREAAALWLRRLCIFMFVLVLMSFLPVLIWNEYTFGEDGLEFALSHFRHLCGLCYMGCFIAFACLAFRAILSAAASADLALANIVRATTTSQRIMQFYSAIAWTRWTAYATLAAMISSILVQGTLIVWMYAGYPPNRILLASYWLGALDFVMNALCAASLSGMLCPRLDLDLANFGLARTCLLTKSPDPLATSSVDDTISS